MSEYDTQECGCEECPDCYRREIRGLEKALQVMSDARAAEVAAVRDECAKAAVKAVNDCRGSGESDLRSVRAWVEQAIRDPAGYAAERAEDGR